MHEYTVELRIEGVDLVPATMTEKFGLEPCTVREVGGRRSETKIWDVAVWGYSGFPAGSAKFWSSLEEGLTFLLDKLERHQSLIDSYKHKYDLVFWCGHFQSSFDGGPTLSANLMRRLADFGVDLYLDNYFYEEDAPKDVSP